MNWRDWLVSPGVIGRLDAILALLKESRIREKSMAGELENLQREVAETAGVVDSAIVFIKGLKDKLDEAIAAGNPEALAALSAELDAKQAELAAAIAEPQA